MPKIFYLSKEIIDNNVNNTTKFEAKAQIIKKNPALTIKYYENLPQGAACEIYYNGSDLIQITRKTLDQPENQLVIQNKKLVVNHYQTLAGIAPLEIWGNEISLIHLKNKSIVLKFVYDIFQNRELINRHQVYLQIKN